MIQAYEDDGDVTFYYTSIRRSWWWCYLYYTSIRRRRWWWWYLITQGWRAEPFVPSASLVSGLSCWAHGSRRLCNTRDGGSLTASELHRSQLLVYSNSLTITSSTIRITNPVNFVSTRQLYPDAFACIFTLVFLCIFAFQSVVSVLLIWEGGGIILCSLLLSLPFFFFLPLDPHHRIICCHPTTIWDLSHQTLQCKIKVHFNVLIVLSHQTLQHQSALFGADCRTKLCNIKVHF